LRSVAKRRPARLEELVECEAPGVLVRRVDEHAVDVEHRALKTRCLDHVTE
jgi:hypothetical protein